MSKEQAAHNNYYYERSRDKELEPKPVIAYVGSTMDIPHAGHVYLLEQAKSMCDFLVVALNTDEFVERFKGKRPIMPLEDRMRVIGAMRMVDLVVVNESGADSKPMLLKFNPDFIVVGDDYTFDKYCKQMDFTPEWLEEHKMKVVFIPRIGGISTTNIKKRVIELSK